MRYLIKNRNVISAVILSAIFTILVPSTKLYAETGTGSAFDDVLHTVELLKENKHYDSSLIVIENELTRTLADHQRITLLNLCATAYMGQQNHSQADSVLDVALTHYSEDSQEDSLKAEIFTNKATANFYLRQFDIARQYIASSLTIRQDLYGQQHELVALNYTNLGMLFGATHIYDSALYFHQKALDIRSVVFGPEHPKTAISLYRMSTIYSTIGQFDAADSLLQIVLKVKQQEMGEDHLSISQILNSIGILRFRKGDLSGAKDFHTRALEIQRKNVPENDTLIAITMTNLANVYTYSHDFQNAEKAYQSVIDIYTEQYGERSISVCQVLTNLASLYNYWVRYKEAEHIYYKVIDIMTELDGPQSMGVAMGKAGLASIYNEQYRLEEAEKPYLESLAIFRRIFGDEHQNVAVTLFNIGLLYDKQGRMLEASKYLTQSLALSKKIFGELHQDNAQTLKVLGGMYKDMGRFDKADSMYQEALSILNQTVPEDHPQVALCYLGFAGTAGERHLYDEAIVYAEKALKIRENLYGLESHPVHYTYTTFGNLYYLMNRFEEAESYYRKVYDYLLNTEDSTNPAMISALSGIGINLYAQEKYSEAIEFHRRAVAQRIKMYSPHHPESVNGLGALADSYCSINNFDSAFVCYEKYFQTRQEFLRYVFSFSSENQKLLWYNYHPLYTNSLFSTALSQNNADYNRLVAETILKCKSIVIDVSLSERKTLLGVESDELQASLDSLQLLRTEAANLFLANLPNRGTGESQRFNQLTAEIESIESSLSERSQEFLNNYRARNFGVNDVCLALESNEVLWEYFKYKPYDHSAVGNHHDHTGDPRYLVVRLDSQGNTDLYDLGSAEIIDSLVALTREKIDASYIHVFSTNASVHEQELKGITNELYNLLVTPIRQHHPDDSMLFVSPDAMLCLMPFEILCNNDDDYFIQESCVSYLGSGRGLLSKSHSHSKKNTAFIFADPDFESASPKVYADKSNLVQQSFSEIKNDRLGQFRSGSCLNSQFQQLDYSRSECEEIVRTLDRHAQFEIKEYLGTHANESGIKGIQQPPYLLHISTHGYFCDRDSQDESLGVINPLLLSGLILSGANQYLSGSDTVITSGNYEDGILTALEVSQLNLMNTELVTLSACETGVGQVVSTEGVFGLCRAFRHAGARSLIASLWKVPDKESSEFMQLFYANWLSGQKKRSALRNASLAMMEKAKQRNNCRHPVLWSGFILTGDPD